MANRRSRPIILLLLLHASAPLAGPYWIQHAARPGAELPPSGQSVFEELFRAHDGSLEIPYPFERLIELLEARIDNGDKPAVRQVLVPVGRALQRDTPAPDYFRYPRQVIAVEGELLTRAGEAGRVVEYRLFIAHQPNTGVLEIISYNDGVARFEFQLVEGYDTAGNPRLHAANRVMCLSCHHNAAPIFARNPWSETSFNLAIARRLVQALPDRFASPIDVITLDAGVIDVLAERANYLAAAQFVWQQGCPTSACRAAMLRAALQYRLSGKINFDRQASSYRQDYFAALARNWRASWPDGVALPGSRIADRDPFAAAPRDARHDPLLPRPPQAVWLDVDAALAGGVVFRLGGYLTLADIRRLDRHLVALAESASRPRSHYRADCRSGPAGDKLIRVECGSGGGPRKLQATLELEVPRQQVTGLEVISLQVPQDSNLWQPAIRELTASSQGLRATFGERRNGLSQRLANGDRLVSMTLDWRDFPSIDSARLEIEISREFEILDAALQRLTVSGPGAPFTDGVFSREAVLQPLMRELGMPPLNWGPKQVYREQPAPRATIRLRGGLALLEPYCAHCHNGAGPNPPGFLSANATRINLVGCAPRMLARLEAWQPASTLNRAPMPPPASIAFSGSSAAQWPASAHYHALLTSLEELLVTEYGDAALQRWRQQDYDRLPRCGGAFIE